jgi:hypothetical protein
MRDFLEAVRGYHLLEEASSITEAKVEVSTDDAMTIYCVRNWSELTTVCENTSYEQIRGIFDCTTNEAYVADASKLTHENIQNSVGTIGSNSFEFYFQKRFGNANQIELKEDYSLRVSSLCLEDEFPPAFERLVGLAPDELNKKYQELIDNL